MIYVKTFRACANLLLVKSEFCLIWSASYEVVILRFSIHVNFPYPDCSIQSMSASCVFLHKSIDAEESRTLDMELFANQALTGDRSKQEPYSSLQEIWLVRRSKSTLRSAKLRLWDLMEAPHAKRLKVIDKADLWNIAVILRFHCIVYKRQLIGDASRCREGLSLDVMIYCLNMSSPEKFLEFVKSFAWGVA